MRKIVIIIILVFILFLTLVMSNKESFQNSDIKYTDNDYEKTVNDINNFFNKYPQYSSLVHDRDFVEAIYNFKLLHDFNTSIILDMRSKQEILYCMIPPDEKNLCRGFRVLNNQEFEIPRLKDKIEYTKSTIDKAIIGKLNVLVAKYNDKNIIQIQNTFNEQLNYLIESIYKNLKIK